MCVRSLMLMLLLLLRCCDIDEQSVESSFVGGFAYFYVFVFFFGVVFSLIVVFSSYGLLSLWSSLLARFPPVPVAPSSPVAHPRLQPIPPERLRRIGSAETLRNAVFRPYFRPGNRQPGTKRQCTDGQQKSMKRRNGRESKQASRQSSYGRAQDWTIEYPPPRKRTTLDVPWAETLGNEGSNGAWEGVGRVEAEMQDRKRK